MQEFPSCASTENQGTCTLGLAHRDERRMILSQLTRDRDSMKLLCSKCVHTILMEKSKSSLYQKRFTTD